MVTPSMSCHVDAGAWTEPSIAAATTRVPPTTYSRHASSMRRDAPTHSQPTSATSRTAAGSAGDTSTRPRYHAGRPVHAESMSTTTAITAVARIAGVTRHDAHPVHCHDHPRATSDRVDDTMPCLPRLNRPTTVLPRP